LKEIDQPDESDTGGSDADEDIDPNAEDDDEEYISDGDDAKTRTNHERSRVPSIPWKYYTDSLNYLKVFQEIKAKNFRELWQIRKEVEKEVVRQMRQMTSLNDRQLCKNFSDGFNQATYYSQRFEVELQGMEQQLEVLKEPLNPTQLSQLSEYLNGRWRHIQDCSRQLHQYMEWLRNIKIKLQNKKQLEIQRHQKYLMEQREKQRQLNRIALESRKLREMQQQAQHAKTHNLSSVSSSSSVPSSSPPTTVASVAATAAAAAAAVSNSRGIYKNLLYPPGERVEGSSASSRAAVFKEKKTAPPPSVAAAATAAEGSQRQEQQQEHNPIGLGVNSNLETKGAASNPAERNAKRKREHQIHGGNDDGNNTGESGEGVGGTAEEKVSERSNGAAAAESAGAGATIQKEKRRKTSPLLDKEPAAAAAVSSTAKVTIAGKKKKKNAKNGDYLHPFTASFSSSSSSSSSQQQQQQHDAKRIDNASDSVTSTTLSPAMTMLSSPNAPPSSNGVAPKNVDISTATTTTTTTTTTTAPTRKAAISQPEKKEVTDGGDDDDDRGKSGKTDSDTKNQPNQISCNPESSRTDQSTRRRRKIAERRGVRMFTAQLKELREMGFKNTRLNLLKLLNEFNGDMQKVVDMLVSDEDIEVSSSAFLTPLG